MKYLKMFFAWISSLFSKKEKITSRTYTPGAFGKLSYDHSLKFDWRKYSRASTPRVPSIKHINNLI
jgi:hypothetical protein